MHGRNMSTLICVTLPLVIIGSTGRSRGQHMYDLCYARGGPHPWQCPQIHADEKVRLSRVKPNEGDWGSGAKYLSLLLFPPSSSKPHFPGSLSSRSKAPTPPSSPRTFVTGSKAVLLSSSSALPCLQATPQPLQTKAARLCIITNKLK